MTRADERRQTIITLLGVLELGRQPDGTEGGRGQGHDSRILQFSRDYNHSLRALDALLEHMRQPNGERHAGHSLATLRRHVIKRYIDNDPAYPKRKPHIARRHHGHIQVLWDGQWQPACTSTREALTEPYNGRNDDSGRCIQYVLLCRWAPDTRLDLANHGIDYLEAHMPGRIQLPGEQEAA